MPELHGYLWFYTPVIAILCIPVCCVLFSAHTLGNLQVPLL